jgi:protease stability complex PrcB-like protein
VTLVAAFAAAFLALQLLPEKPGHRVAWHDLSAQVGPLAFSHSERRVFRTRAKLTDFLGRAQAARPVPRVDFSRRQLLLVSPGPRSSSGYRVEILSVRERDGKLTVKVRERTPGLGNRVRPRVTFPYRLIGLPAGKDVFVDWVGR